MAKKSKETSKPASGTMPMHKAMAEGEDALAAQRKVAGAGSSKN